MGKYQPYQTYDDSGVLSFGKIPTHWAAKPLKVLSTYNDEVLPESTDPDIAIEYVDISSVSATDGIKETTTVNFGAAPSRARRIVRDGDVLVSTVRTYLEAIAWVENPPDNMIASTGFAVIRTNPSLLNRRYAGYALRARYFIDEVVSRSVGVSYPAINASDLVSIKVPVPALDEQVTIATFLDHETTKIDHLIAKQERLIGLLKEKRQAVISHAVTKGLNPDAPMKDSGVEWLGEVPAHWEITRVARLFSERVEYGRSDLPILSVSIHYGVTDKELTQEESDRKLQRIENKESYKIVAAGELVYNMMRAWQGAFGTAKVDGLVSPAYVIAKPIVDMNTEYFEAVLRTNAGMEEMRRYSKGITDFRLRLYWDEFRNLQLPVPPAQEQEAIVAKILEVTETTKRIIDKAGESISLMKEHRTALISAAVTGKIDVRNFKPANA